MTGTCIQSHQLGLPAQDLYHIKLVGNPAFALFIGGIGRAAMSAKEGRVTFLHEHEQK